MQDNRIDDGFVDGAWQEMKMLLDAELPVKSKRRRRLLPILLLFGTGLLIATVSFSYYGKRSKIADDSNLIVIPSTKTVSGPHATHVEDEDCEGDSPFETPQLNATKNVEVQAVEEYAGFSSRKEKSWFFERLPAIEPVQLSQTAPPVRERVEWRIPLRSFARIPSLTLALKDAGQEPVIAASSMNQKRYSMGIELGYQSLEKTYLTGTSANVFLRWDLGKSRRWYFYSGLGWQYLRYDGARRSLGGSGKAQLDAASSAPEESQRASDPLSASLDTSQVGVSAADAITGNFTAGMHFLYLPVMVGKRFGHRWEAAVGGGVTFRIADNIQFSDESAFTLDNFVLGQGPNRYTVALDENSNRFDYTLLGQVYYRFDPSWSIGLGYQYGLRSVLRDQDQKIRRRFSNLSVRYKF